MPLSICINDHGLYQETNNSFKLRWVNPAEKNNVCMDKNNFQNGINFLVGTFAVKRCIYSLENLQTKTNTANYHQLLEQIKFTYVS